MNIKKSYLIIITLLVIEQINAQVTMDFSYGLPFQIDEVNKIDFNYADNYSYTGNIKYLKKSLGIGLQYNFSEYHTNEHLLDRFYAITAANLVKRDFDWKSHLLSIGPILKFGKGKLNLELFPKFSGVYTKSPDRNLVYDDGPIPLTLYVDNNDNRKSGSYQLSYGIDARVNMQFTPVIGMYVYAGLNTNYGFDKGVSTIYREMDNPNENTNLEDILNSPLLQVDCTSYNLLTTGVGFSITLGLKKPDKEKQLKDDAVEEDPEEEEEMMAPQPEFPENEATLSLQEGKELTLSWLEEKPNVKQANYNFYLYQRIEENEDSLIYSTKTKRELELKLPEDITLELGKSYIWRVQAADHKRLKPCPDDCYSDYFEFSINNLKVHRFYELLTANTASYVEVSDSLRFIVDQNMVADEELMLEVFDEMNKVILEIDLLSETENLKILPFDRYILNISQLEVNTHYSMSVSNGKRKHFLSFFRPSNSKEKINNEK